KRTANHLVQGTLAPVRSVRNIVKLLGKDHTYVDAKGIPPTLSIALFRRPRRQLQAYILRQSATTIFALSSQGSLWKKHR
ncbi:hypothetical protein JG687_00019067, partial [Phytophthora cactorum]